MKLELRLDDRMATSEEEVERMARWTLGAHEDSLRTVVIELGPAGWDDWARCRVRTTARTGERLDWQGTGPDALACVRNMLRRAERTLRRASVRKSGRVSA